MFKTSFSHKRNGMTVVVITELFGSAIPLTIHSDQPATSAGGPIMLSKEKKKKCLFTCQTRDVYWCQLQTN